MPLFGKKQKQQVIEKKQTVNQKAVDESLEILNKMFLTIKTDLDCLEKAGEGSDQIRLNLLTTHQAIMTLADAIIAIRTNLINDMRVSRNNLGEIFLKQGFIDANSYEQLKNNFKKLEKVKTDYDANFAKILKELNTAKDELNKLSSKMEIQPAKPKIEFIHEGKGLYKESRGIKIDICKILKEIRENEVEFYNMVAKSYDDICDEYDDCNTLIYKFEQTKKVKPDVVKSTTAQMQAFMPEIKGSAKPVANAKATTAPAPTVPRQPSPETTAKVSNVSQFKPVPSLPQTKNSQYDNRYVR